MQAVREISGLLVVDKPSGPTSHAVVARVRKLLRTKVGHLGTLDPAATGVLPLVMGRATRLARFLSVADKEYRARIRLGSVTDTCDGEGKVVLERTVPEVSSRVVEELLAGFVGEVTQVPPMFSAVKVDGERLYKAARRGEVRERPERTVNIYRLDVVDRQALFWDVSVHCSSGTYIRTLAYDIGERLGCGAHLETLRRTRSGSYDLTRAIRMEAIETGWESALVPIHELLPDFPIVQVDERGIRAVLHGNPVETPAPLEGDYCRITHGERLLAVGRIQGSRILPKIVLQTSQGGQPADYR